MSSSSIAAPPASASSPSSSSSSSTPAATPSEPLVHIYTQNILSQLPAGVTPSAGSLPVCGRLSAPNVDTVIFAMQNHVALMQPLPPLNPTIRLGRTGPFISDFIPLTSIVTPLPHHMSQHRGEIECVQSRSTLSTADGRDEYDVATVDCYGVAVRSRMHIPRINRDDMDSSSSASSSSPYTVLSSHTLLPHAYVEDGHHSIALHPTFATHSCVSSHTGRSLSLYDGDRLLQVLYTSQSPTCISYLQSPHSRDPLLVCTEGNTVSVWDVRMSNGVGECDNISRGAVQRIQETAGDLYALDTHSSGILAAGGVDKQVTVYDCRKWTALGRWKNVLKYEIMSLSFAAVSPSYIYVTGMDHEVYCGHWSNLALNQRNLERMAFRGDARWVGLARTSDVTARGGGDQLVGLTTSGQVYVLRNAHLQNGPIAATAASSKSMQSTADAKRRREGTEAERRKRIEAGTEQPTEEEQSKRAKREQGRLIGGKKKNETAMDATASTT